MKTQKIFYQDFLFEDMPVDEQEYPDVVLRYITADKSFDAYYSISFNTLLRMNKEIEWLNLYSETVDKSVCIIDDVPLKNNEMKYYKELYMRVYYYNISKHCLSCYCKKATAC